MCSLLLSLKGLLNDMMRSQIANICNICCYCCLRNKSRIINFSSMIRSIMILGMLLRLKKYDDHEFLLTCAVLPILVQAQGNNVVFFNVGSSFFCFQVLALILDWVSSFVLSHIFSVVPLYKVTKIYLEIKISSATLHDNLRLILKTGARPLYFCCQPVLKVMGSKFKPRKF